MINIPDILPDQRQYLDTRELYTLTQRFLLAQIKPWDVDDLCALDESPDEDTGKLVRNKVRYETRLTQVFFSEAGLVGKCTQLQYLGILHYAYENELKRLQDEQPGCAWSLVAADLQRVNINVTREVAFRGEVYSVDNLLQFHKSKDAKPMEQTVTYQGVPDYRCVVPLVFADLERGELVDPALNSPQGKEGPFSKYARMRTLRYLTESQRRTRLVAEALIRQVAARREVGSELPKPTEVGPNHDRDTIESLRARLAALEAEEKAREVAASDAIEVPETPPLADELSDRIVSMRRDRQMLPKDIASELALPLSEVQRVLRSARP